MSNGRHSRAKANRVKRARKRGGWRVCCKMDTGKRAALRRATGPHIELKAAFDEVMRELLGLD